MFVGVRWQEAEVRPRDKRSTKAFVPPLDRVFGEMNAFLVAMAIGLAALDATGFVGTRCADLLQVKSLATRVASAASPATADAFVASAR
jgi:hypothetical protein